MLMLFWDEWMGFDWYAFRQFLFTLGSLCTLISLVAMTEGVLVVATLCFHPWIFHR